MIEVKKGKTSVWVLQPKFKVDLKDINNPSSIDEAKALIQSVKNKNVIGGDVVCLMPTKDQKNNITAMVAASIMFEIISVIAFK